MYFHPKIARVANVLEKTKVAKLKALIVTEGL